MKQSEVKRVRDRMEAAGRDAFNMGKPCVPGLDPLWHREITPGPDENGKATPYATNLAHLWRYGWKNQAELVERVACA